jgi:hypothetical protein
MARLSACVRIAARQSAVWRTCAGCTVLAPLGPDQSHCRQCRPAAAPARPVSGRT